jgi:hypothetical protein
VKSKLKIKKEKKKRESLAVKCAYVWALRAAVDHRAERTEASLTCLEHVQYYLSKSGKSQSPLKSQLMSLIDISKVSKEQQHVLSHKNFDKDEPAKPEFDLLTIKQIKELHQLWIRE